MGHVCQMVLVVLPACVRLNTLDERAIFVIS